MSKLITMVGIMTGLMLLFYFTGLIQEQTDEGNCEGQTPNSKLLNILLQPQCMKDSTIGRKAVLVVGSVAGVLVIAAALFIPNIELAIMGSLAIYFLTLLWDFMVVFQKVWESSPVFAILFFGPLMFIFIIVIIDWWRGR